MRTIIPITLSLSACVFAVFHTTTLPAAPFLRGDANSDAAVDLADAVYGLLDLFVAPAAGGCKDAADVNDDGTVDVTDPISLLQYLFLRGALPPDPGPFFAGYDGTPGDPFTCGDAPAGGESSLDLIGKALAGGTIDAETALIYQFYAAFQDSRLPAAFAGSASPYPDLPAIGDATGKFDQLSAATQEILAPFLLPPSAPGSWLELRAGGGGQAAPAAIQWGKVAAVGGKVRVWWELRRPADEADAIRVAAAIDLPIWPDLTGLMGREPMDDSNLFNNGGDGALDIYLVQISILGICIPYPPKCKNTPTFVLLAPGRPKLLQTVTHEFMHVLQFAQNVQASCLLGEYTWLAEATATWSEDFVYRHDDSEHEKAHWFMLAPDLPLEFNSGGPLCLHCYGAYLLPFFLDRSLGNPGIVKAIWDGARGDDSLEAVNQAIPGGFEEQWPLFARKNWNQVPVDDYQKWDELTEHSVASPAQAPVEVDLQGRPELELSLENFEFKHLGALYYHLKFTDETARTVVFYNGFTNDLGKGEPIPGLGVYTYTISRLDAQANRGNKLEALVKFAGQDWKEAEDWTHVPYVRFCRDKVAERITELVLIFSNSDHQDRGRVIKPAGLPPLLYVNNTGCWRWSGDLTATLLAAGVTTTIQATVQMDARPESEEAGGQGGIVGPIPGEIPNFAMIQTYDVAHGTLSAEVHGTDPGGCTYSGSATGLPIPPDAPNVMNVYHFALIDPYRRGIILSGFLGAGGAMMEFTQTINCPGGVSAKGPAPIPPYFAGMLDPMLRPEAVVSESGTRMASRVIHLQGNTSITFQMNLQSEREP